jgi:hypothetical protein
MSSKTASPVETVLTANSGQIELSYCMKRFLATDSENNTTVLAFLYSRREYRPNVAFKAINNIYSRWSS